MRCTGSWADNNIWTVVSPISGGQALQGSGLQASGGQMNWSITISG